MPAAIRWLINSVLISLMAMLITCFTASLAGYALAKKTFWGKGFIFTLFVCAMALPKQVILIPLVTLAKNLGMSESLWSVILPIAGWPFGVFLMKQFSETIPTSLLEAARIDGAGELRDVLGDRRADHQARHRRSGHLHLHQRLERVPAAAGHAAQDGSQNDFTGHRQPAG
jgi:ABC-type glycerol-3-phosphate transport system permease component